ncbi:insulinase family protein [Mucilaginibacter pallidiroseus]|uniref:Insulinase family protein n=1 Tax=Mucilaginibacter pallidiroseus TaxID=2599295 RepID=A0A563UDF8_9SPHI|nr:M16 family metallopeptidase [Mucilaginibacter pallidiroseus]TWR29360.1 insulinase family protein [Mucilaginibacter pallidiroseus]
MKLRLTLMLLLMGGYSAHLSAQNNYAWKTATGGGYTYKYVTGDPTHSRFYTLKNGLTVILSPTDKQPRIQAYIAVKAGSKTDPADHTGLAHYLEHMMFKGTDKFGTLNWAKEKPLLDKIDELYEQYNSTKDEGKRKEIYKDIDKTSGEAAKFAIANEYDKMMSAMGGQNSNAFTSFEQTVYTEDIPSSAVDKFLTMQAERFRKPVLRIFHTELEAVYEEKNRGLDSDPSKVWEALFEGLFPNNNYGKQTTIGTIEHLKNPSLKAIRKYYYDYYVPNNMGIILSGDFNPDVMIKKIAQHFNSMTRKPVPPYKITPEAPITTPVIKEVYGPNPENLTIAYRFPGASTRDARLLSLMGSLLTNGKAGLFDLDLTKKQKLLSASASANTLKDYSVLILRGTPVKGQSLDDVKTLMLAEIDKLRKGQFSDDLIQSIVNNYKRSKIEQDESYTQRASNLMDDFTSGVDWRTDVAAINELSKVTKAQIVAFANQYLKDNNYVAVYKRQGADKNVVKVEKPAITPVEVNAGEQSPYVKMINTMPANAVQPVWLDFGKDIQRSKSGPVDVLSVQNKDNSIFRLYYRFDMGSWNNKLLPVAAQYLQFLGTDKQSSEDISKAFYKLASTFSVNASTETSMVTISGLQENFGPSVSLFENLLANCKADEQALAGLKARLKKSRENLKLNKAALLQGLVNYAQYGADNPFNYTLSDEDIDNLKAQQLVDILHSLVNYKHTILYYGPQNAAQVGTSLATLHKTPATFTAYPAKKVFTRTQVNGNKVLFANYDMVQAEIQWVRNESMYNPASNPVINAFNNYFGGGMNSIVFQQIRESKALAYSTYAYYSQSAKKDDNDIFVGYVGTQADKMNEAIKSMNDLINNMPQSEKGLIAAKDNIRKSIETERVTQDGIIFSYLAAQRKGLDYDERKNTFNEVNKLTLTDLANFNKKELQNKPFIYCIVASDKRVTDDDMKKYGELIKPDMKQIFGY